MGVSPSSYLAPLAFRLVLNFSERIAKTAEESPDMVFPYVAKGSVAKGSVAKGSIANGIGVSPTVSECCYQNDWYQVEPRGRDHARRSPPNHWPTPGL